MSHNTDIIHYWSLNSVGSNPSMHDWNVLCNIKSTNTATIVKNVVQKHLKATGHQNVIAIFNNIWLFCCWLRNPTHIWYISFPNWCILPNKMFCYAKERTFDIHCICKYLISMQGILSVFFLHKTRRWFLLLVTPREIEGLRHTRSSFKVQKTSYRMTWD